MQRWWEYLKGYSLSALQKETLKRIENIIFAGQSGIGVADLRRVYKTERASCSDQYTAAMRLRGEPYFPPYVADFEKPEEEAGSEPDAHALWREEFSLWAFTAEGMQRLLRIPRQDRFSVEYSCSNFATSNFDSLEENLIELEIAIEFFVDTYNEFSEGGVEEVSPAMEESLKSILQTWFKKHPDTDLIDTTDGLARCLGYNVDFNIENDYFGLAEKNLPKSTLEILEQTTQRTAVDFGMVFPDAFSDDESSSLAVGEPEMYFYAGILIMASDYWDDVSPFLDLSE